MKKTIICLMFVFLSLFFVGSFQNVSVASAINKESVSSEDLKISAKSALLIEYNTGKVLYEKKANEKLPIASMTKLATLWVVFDAIDKGAVKESDVVTVSKTASRVGGSSAFLDNGSMYKLTDLIKTVIIASANDSSVALAEHIAGSEDVFVSKMNKFAKSKNLENTHFANCTGLPADDHYSTASDMAIIYKEVCNNPIYKKYSKLWMDELVHPSGRRTGLVNTNRLVKTYEGIEGGKTGFTNAARFCLTTSACRGNLRLIAVVIGAGDSKTRFAEASKLLNYGFANYDSKMMVSKDVPVTIKDVPKTEQKVEVYPKDNLSILINKNDNKTFTVDYKIDEIKAPINSGDVVGKLFVFDEANMVVDEIELIVKRDVKELSFKERLRKFVNVW